ncbi:hypothetical protein L2X99_06765 [Microbacterium sp. KUDC0406]|uniref:hypothetical protein n=1 Tax=Microbacterium sp. KUDC0406 TaxID=2909588 RepID=UPI001F2133B2|nr:hypothetical protein [Microbacterium sp. KUDC0406]UJP11238.1 hypothetical protein L2X99_06765 [Microbacterium sp. KUDC0406]
MNTAEKTAGNTPSRFRSVLSGFVTGVAGLAYAYLIWNAIAFLISVAPFGLQAMDWVALLFAAVLPALVFTAAIVLARRRSLWQYAIVLLAGLGLAAVFWLNVLSYMMRSIALS